MKKAGLTIIFLVLVVTAGCFVYLPPDEEGSGHRGTRYDREERSEYRNMDSSYFYEYLAPYGTWISYHPYGYVWIPHHMRYNWRPYSFGRWIWTDYGWTWISGYEWGWIPFHYGRWGWDRRLGWFWVPDTVWGPAWVTWRTGGSYLGWAALPPEALYRDGYGIRSSEFDIYDPCWVFVDGRHFLDERLDRYVLPYERNYTIINLTIITTNIFVRGERIINEGMGMDHVRRLTQREINKYQLRDPGRPGYSRVEANEVVLSKPSLSRNQLAKPKNALSRDEAVEKISSGELKRAEDVLDEPRLKTEQEREEQLLEESQDVEVHEIRKKTDEDKKSARTTVDQQRLEEEYQAKVSVLKKKHEEEKTELVERHRKEVEEAKKDRLKKKD